MRFLIATFLLLAGIAQAVSLLRTRTVNHSTLLPRSNQSPSTVSPTDTPRAPAVEDDFVAIYHDQLRRLLEEYPAGSTIKSGSSIPPQPDGRPSRLPRSNRRPPPRTIGGRSSERPLEEPQSLYESKYVYKKASPEEYQDKIQRLLEVIPEPEYPLQKPKERPTPPPLVWVGRNKPLPEIPKEVESAPQAKKSKKKWLSSAMRRGRKGDRLSPISEEPVPMERDQRASPVLKEDKVAPQVSTRTNEGLPSASGEVKSDSHDRAGGDEPAFPNPGRSFLKWFGRNKPLPPLPNDDKDLSQRPWPFRKRREKPSQITWLVR